MGCQKGAGWSHMHYSQERVLYPLKRVGERGSGKWKRISWDQALTEVADSVIDAIQEQGPESIIHLSGCNLPTGGIVGRGRFSSLIGASTMDLNAEMNDFAPGHYLTYGVFDPVSSIDDWFHSELIFIWFSNPAYTRIPHQHYITEARYRGGQTVVVAPDFNPSAIHADYYVPVKPGSDAAFALGMSPGRHRREAVQRGVHEGPDRPAPARPRSTRGRTYVALTWPTAAATTSSTGSTRRRKPSPRPPGRTLALGEVDPALEGTFTAKLKDGKSVEVTTVFELVKKRLNGLHAGEGLEDVRRRPEHHPRARPQGGQQADHDHRLPRQRLQVSTTATSSSAPRLLLLALTGNWGRKGTGVRAWLGALFDGYFVTAAKGAPGTEATKRVTDMIQARWSQAVQGMDPTMTDEMAMIEMAKRAPAMGSPPMVPPIFVWYYHAGFDKIWTRDDWHDPSMKRPFQEYWDEAMEKGWWDGVVAPGAGQEPRVFIEMGGNALRRTRGGQNMLLKHLWPKLKMVAVIDAQA